MKYLQNRATRLLFLTLVLNVLFFSTTNPAKVAPLWLIVGFILAIATLYWFFRGVILLVGLYSKAICKQEKQLAKGLTVAATLVLALQSMGQLTVRDLLVLLPLVVLGYFYLRYGRRSEVGN